MKKLLAICLLVVALATSGFADALFTVLTTGGTRNWHDDTAYTVSGGTPSCPNGGHPYPCSIGDPGFVSGVGDQVVIPSTAGLLCESTSQCFVGNSPSDTTTLALSMTGTGTFALGNNSTFVYEGNVSLTCCNFNMGDGINIYPDSSHSALHGQPYLFRTRTSGSGSATVSNILGTCPSQDPITGVCNGGNHWWGNSWGKSWANTTNCPTADDCLAGAIGWNSTNYTTVDAGLLGTVNNLHFHYVLGSANGTHKDATQLSIKTVNTVWNGVTFDSTGRIYLVIDSAATGSFHWTNCQVWNNINPVFTGVQIVGATNATGTYGYSNCDIQTRIVDATAGDKTWTNLNNILETSLDGSVVHGTFPNDYSGFAGTDAGTYIGLFLYQNASNSGASPAGNRLATYPNYNISHSVIWGPYVAYGNVQPTMFKTIFSSFPGDGSPATAVDNVSGSLGSITTGGSEPAGQNSITATAPGTGAQPVLIARNVSMAGYDGGATTNGFEGNCVSPCGNVSITYSNYVSYADQPGSSYKNRGAISPEVLNPAGIFASVNSGIVGDDFTTPVFVSALCSNSTLQGTTKFVTELANTTSVNSNSGTSMVCPGSNGASWVNSITNELYLTGPLTKYLAQPWRQPALFDVLYAIPAGLMDGVVGQSPSTYWAAQSGFTGAWSASYNGHGDNKYHAGDIVSFNGGSGVFRGITVYMICRTTHTPDATINQPIVGNDSSNPYKTPLWWEFAYMPWLRATVISGKAFNDGVLGAHSLHNTVQSSSDVGIIELMQRWVQRGTDSTFNGLWGTGKNGTDRGMPRTKIEHMPFTGGTS
jgi:hypothetical protein